MLPKEESPLESMRDRLYQQPTTPTVEVPAYSGQEIEKPYGWQAPPPPPPPKKRLPWTVWFLIGTGAFLVVAGLVAAFLIFGGARAISSDRVEITVEAPVSIASGDAVSIVVKIHNGNPTQLNDATLFVALPEGTRTGDATDAPLPQYSDVLGDIPAGADVTRTIQVKLFGTENKALVLPIKVEYRTDGSNALFVSRKEYSLMVATSPISVQVQTLSQTPSGQPLTLTVVVRSNASSPVSNVALSAQYPSGFQAKSADPAPTGSNFFVLGTLEPGEQKTVKITGTLIGQNADQRVFRFIAGSVNGDGTSTLGNAYSEGAAAVAITHPFLNVGLSLNREVADTVIAEPGETVGALLSWQNSLAGTLTNASIRVALTGNALDVSSIKGGTGFYRSQDGSVIFDSSTNSSLGSLSAGDTGAGSFGFAIKPAASLAGVKNPTVTLSVSVSGQQATQGSSAQMLTSTLTRMVKVGTEVTVASVLSRGTGPVPPTVGSETTYTVSLTAKNSVNSVGAAKETFQLPSYVRYTGTAGTGVTYNPDTRTVTWTIGDLAPGATATSQFQIGFTPSTSQIGSAPVLVNEQAFSGVDRFTQQQVSATAPSLTSELPGSASSGTVK